MPKRQNQSHHDQMVKYVHGFLVGENYTDVRADLEGYNRPELIYWKSTKKGHKPDVTAAKNGTQNLFEIETADSISDQHTEDQWTLFAANAKQHGKIFTVVVPDDSQASANQRLIELGIQAQVWKI